MARNRSLSLPILLAMSSALVERSLEGGLVIVGGLNLGGSVEPIYNAVGISTPQYFQLIYGVLIVGLVLFLPNGLVSLFRRRGIDVP